MDVLFEVLMLLVAFAAGAFAMAVSIFLTVLYMRRHPEATRPRGKGS